MLRNRELIKYVYFQMVGDSKTEKDDMKGLPPQGAAAAVRAEYKQDLAAWLEGKDTCVSSIYEACRAYLRLWRS